MLLVCGEDHPEMALLDVSKTKLVASIILDPYKKDKKFPDTIVAEWLYIIFFDKNWAFGKLSLFIAGIWNVGSMFS